MTEVSGYSLFNCARKLEFVTQFSGKFLREFFQRVFAMKLIAKLKVIAVAKWVCQKSVTVTKVEKIQRYREVP